MTNTPMTPTAQLEARVWQLIKRIPAGRVATYGQIARLAGMPQQARLVGRILARLPAETGLPWHRVVNGRGEVSNPNPTRQCQHLTDEGVAVANHRVSLRAYQWQP
ncbi:MGMT family protein [Pseudomonadales bacterium]|nr:MGMT family protein [Pseudomonadales bacterium]